MVLNQRLHDLEEPEFLKEPSGSNGIAIAPKNTTGGNALLLINPHTSFFFRSELQVTSGEGLNAYGAATWGQIFIYQGFNERLGWMHTSSAVDAIDEWRETVLKKGDKYFYKFGGEERPVLTSVIKVRIKPRREWRRVRLQFTARITVRSSDAMTKRAIGSVGLMNEPVKALTQSFTRTKAKNYKSFGRLWSFTRTRRTLRFTPMPTETSLIFTRISSRAATLKFDWTKPVDGSDPKATGKVY
jgi:acyl-homoserine-lactone acylase